METNQIIRIPIKYGELFRTMSDEESGKLIKSLFIGNNDGLTGLTLTYYNIIMVDINNLYNSASNGKKGGRPKKKPGVIENDNLGLGKSITNTSKDKIKEDKIKEDIPLPKEDKKVYLKYIKEYEDFILTNKNITSIILKVFFALGYKPTESLDKFREWVQVMIINSHKIENIEKFEFIMNNFYVYWNEQPASKRVNKIWKTTLVNSFHLKDIRK